MNTPTQEQSIAARLVELPNLPMKQLWALWDKYFPRRPPHSNRAYLEGRIAYKIQEESFGSIQPSLHRQLIEIGEAQSKMSKRKPSQFRITPGTVFVREHADREHRVTALADGGFEYEGQRFRSLSAAARRIAGCQWSGPAFFGLVKTERRTR